MFGKPHLDNNAHTHACQRTTEDFQRMADDPNLSPLVRQMARQVCDMAQGIKDTITRFGS